MATFGNLLISGTSSAYSSVVGGAFSAWQTALARGGSGGLRFYYDYDAGGSILQVAGRAVAGGFVNGMAEMASEALRSLLYKKENNLASTPIWVEDMDSQAEEEAMSFGKMDTGKGTILALDDRGDVCTDALMLGIMLDKEVTTTQYYAGDKRGMHKFNTVKSKMLVWYDTTALVNTNSDKNIITTKVQGRDYSRKELVSNGDIRINVTGQITSGMPDVYPTAEVKKFLSVMQYKGIVKVNNQVLANYGIENIIITDFNLPSKEGGKSVQSYSFSALGLTPKKQEQITTDTIKNYTTISDGTVPDTRNGWKDLLEGIVDGAKNMAMTTADQGIGMATGILNKWL